MNEFVGLDQVQQAHHGNSVRRERDAGHRRDRRETAEASRRSGHQDQHRRHRSERREEPPSRSRPVRDSGGASNIERDSGRLRGAVGDAVDAAPAHRQRRSEPPASSAASVHPAASNNVQSLGHSGQVAPADGAARSQGSAAVDGAEATEDSGHGDEEGIQQAGEVEPESGPASSHPGEYTEVIEDPDQESRDAGSVPAGGRPRQSHVRVDTPSPRTSARRGPSRAAMAAAERRLRDRRGYGMLGAPGPSSQARPSSSHTAGTAGPGNNLVDQDHDDVPCQVEGVPDSQTSLPPTISSDSSQPDNERRRSRPKRRSRPQPARPATRSRQSSRERPAPARPALQTPNPFGPLASRSPSAGSAGPSNPPERRAQVGPDFSAPSSSSLMRRDRRRHPL